MSKPKTGGVIEVILMPDPDAKPRDTSKRPWAKRAEELFESEGYYADHAAWEGWLERLLSRTDLGRDLHELLENETTTEMVALYTIMCDLADGGEDA